MVEFEELPPDDAASAGERATGVEGARGGGGACAVEVDDLEAGATGGGAECGEVNAGGTSAPAPAGASPTAGLPVGAAGDGDSKGDDASGAGDELPELGVEEAAERIAEADALKAEGNALFKSGDFAGARERYSAALAAAPAARGAGAAALAAARAVYHANRAAAALQAGDARTARDDCDASLRLAPGAPKVLMRRARALEALEEVEAAHADAQAAADAAEDNSAIQKDAKAMVVRLQPAVDAAREKLKEETMEQLKGLGNSVLGMFGMSLDNFEAKKDPSTGSYSISFKQ